jgi:hypothetical protein
MPAVSSTRYSRPHYERQFLGKGTGEGSSAAQVGRRSRLTSAPERHGEGFFSKLARSVLRHIRVSSKHELSERLMAFIDDINREPVVYTWRYKIDNAA